MKEEIIKEGADAYCQNCGENLGKAVEVADKNGKAYCGNCGQTTFVEGKSKTAKCPDCGGKYLIQTGYCVSCKKKVGNKDKKKESGDFIEITQDVVIGNHILEKGDKIKILKEGRTQQVSIEAEVLFQRNGYNLIEIEIRGGEPIYLVVSEANGVVVAGELGSLDYAKQAFEAWVD